MNNKTKIQDLIDKAEKYRYDKLTPRPEVKSRLTLEESKENKKIMIDVINKMFRSKYVKR